MDIPKSRWFKLALSALIVLLTLAACAGAQENSPAPTNEPTQPAPSPTQPAPTATAVPPTATPVPPTPTPVPSATPSETAVALEDQPAADSSAYTIANWPTPPNATDIAISGDTLSFKVDLPLVDVAEFYRPTFDMLELGTSCLDGAAEYTSLSCSISNGDVSLNFFAFEGFDNSEVEIEFINSALASSDDTTGGSGGLGVEDKDGLPLPDDYTSYSSDGGEFRRRIDASSPSDVDTLTDLFETELATRGWTLDEASPSSTGVTLRFSGPEGELVLTLQSGDETEIALVTKDAAAASEAGILPPVGQARIYLANLSDGNLTVSIDGEEIEVAAGAGTASPDDAPKLDLPPGAYEVTTTTSAGSVIDQVTVGADETWVLLLDEQGALPLQMY
jgi:hypothetical protein